MDGKEANRNTKEEFYLVSEQFRGIFYYSKVKVLKLLSMNNVSDDSH